MLSDNFKTIFKKGSRTFFNASWFFPPEVMKEVAVLYAFVRKADDLVDCVPAKTREFQKLKQQFLNARKSQSSKNEVVTAMVKLEVDKNFKLTWMDRFLNSMEMDLTKNKYRNLKETEGYMYGSANVIGLFMAKLLGLSEQSYSYAEMLGKSFQFLNFIRDIEEDVDLGRNYFPQPEMKKFGLETLHQKEAESKVIQFESFIRYQLDRYYQWQKEAENGFKYIPIKYLVAIKTASDLYKWTATVISRDPMVVYQRKVKPSVSRILFVGIKNWLWLMLSNITYARFGNLGGWIIWQPWEKRGEF